MPPGASTPRPRGFALLLACVLWALSAAAPAGAQPAPAVAAPASPPTAPAASQGASPPPAPTSAAASEKPGKPAAPAQDAAAVIARFQDNLITVMKQAEKLGYQGRYEQLAPVVKRVLDLEAIARVAVGQYWSGLDAKQRTTLVDTFTRLSIATYAARFDGYSGERFTKPKEQVLRPGLVLVKSNLIKSDGGTVSFDYQMREAHGHWQAINIITNGVSDLALKRAEYTSVIKNNGFDELIQKLKQKTTDYEHGKTD